MTKIVWFLTIISILINLSNGNSQRTQLVFGQRIRETTTELSKELLFGQMIRETTTELSKKPVFEHINWDSTTELIKEPVLPRRNLNTTKQWVKPLDDKDDILVGYSRQLIGPKKMAEDMAVHLMVNYGNPQTQKNLQSYVTTPDSLRRQTFQQEAEEMPPDYDAAAAVRRDKDEFEFILKPGITGGSPFASDYFSSKELWDIARNIESKNNMPIHAASRQGSSGYNRVPFHQSWAARAPATPSPVRQPAHPHFLDAGKEDGPSYGLLEGGPTKMAIMKQMFEKAKRKLVEVGSKLKPLSVESQLKQLPKKDDFGKPVRWVKFNSDEVSYGIAKVTDPLTMNNQQFTIEGAIYVPVKSRTALKTGTDTEVDYQAMFESDPGALTTAPLNETIQVVARNVKVDQITSMDWLVTETMTINDIVAEKSCIANKCPARCRNMNCDSMCNGAFCTSGCVGVSCNAFCSGTGCLSMCVGEACSSKCTGYNCSTRCWGSGCKANCAHHNCFQYVNGVYNKRDPSEEPIPKVPEKPSTRDNPKFTGYSDLRGSNTFVYDYGIPNRPNEYERPRGPEEYGRGEYSKADELGAYARQIKSSAYGRPSGSVDYGRAGELSGFGKNIKPSGYGRPGVLIGYGRAPEAADYRLDGQISYDRPLDYGRLGRPNNYGRGEGNYGGYGRLGDNGRSRPALVYNEPVRPGYVRPGGPDGFRGPGYSRADVGLSPNHPQGVNYKRAGVIGSNGNLWDESRSDIRVPDDYDNRPVFLNKEEENNEKILAAERTPKVEYVDEYALAADH